MENETLFQFTKETSVAALMDEVTRAGYSNTQARRAVLQALVRSPAPVSPAELLAGGRALHPALGLVTVYRTLEILDRLGLARKLHLAEGCHRYALSASPRPDDAAAAGDPHGHHVICQECHRAVEFAGCDIDAIIAAAHRQTGFAVRSHWLELFGLCPACLEGQT